MKTILETVDLVKYYGEGENQVKAIDHTSIQVNQGGFVAIVGRSGSGKSTLLHMLGGLDRPDSGEVVIGGENIFALILADEPTGNLDSRTEMEVMTALKNCVDQYGQTLVMITHDETIAQMADRILVIEDGKVVE